MHPVSEYTDDKAPWKSVLCANQGYLIIVISLPVYNLFVIFKPSWTVSVVCLPLPSPSPACSPGLLMEGNAVISTLSLLAPSASSEHTAFV